MKRLITIGLAYMFIGYAIAQDSLCIVSYNVENLFHPEHDSLKEDWDFTPKGIYRWTKYRYYRKVEQIGRVITNIGSTQSPAIIGLTEVENKQCLDQLAKMMRHYPLKSMLYEGLDRRGIDVGILFDTTQVELLFSRPIRVATEADGFVTRDVLYAYFRVRSTGEWLHVLQCHLPSQRGGAAASAWKRALAKQKLQVIIDSIIGTDPQANIIMMGDMNSQPQEDMLPLRNMMLQYRQKGRGTHRYQGVWTCLDQVYLSDRLTMRTAVSIYEPHWLVEHDRRYLGFKPKRTFTGFRYNKNGFSDHLPVVITIAK